MLTEQNGILNRGIEAKKKTEMAETIERARIELLGKKAENNGDIKENEIETIVAKYDKEKKIRDDREEKYIITEKGYEINVSEIWKETTLEDKILAKDVLKINPDAEEGTNKSSFVIYKNLNCRVLYNDQIHGIQIITEESVDNVSLGKYDKEVTAKDFTYTGTVNIDENFRIAAASYNNLVDNLNNKAKTYMDTNGIAIDARCLGSMPTLTSEGKFQKDSSGMWIGTEGYLETYGWNNIFKTTDTNYLEDIKQLKDLELNETNTKWTVLASRVVYNDGSDSYLGARRLYTGGSDDRYELFGLFDDGSYYSSEFPLNGFRPIFLLSNDAVISRGDGSSENPYVIE